MKLNYLLLASLLILTFSAIAQEPEIFSNKDGAIRGYDAVAYFKEGKPVKGNSKFSYEWKAAKWFFATKENMDSFKAAPEKYAPQYGGYCAYGLSENHKSPTSPDAFTIVNNKLYFNYNQAVKKMWVPDTIARITKADSLWKLLK